MDKELQIDDLTRGINDDEPVFNETERRESEAREQDTALPGDKCWQDFMTYASWTATWPTRSTTATSVAAAVPTS